MSICPEAEYRNSLPDFKFWDYVLNWDGGWSNWYQNVYHDLDEYPELDDPPTSELFSDQTCSVCRSKGACGYDSEGRPMIHTIEDSEDE